jgi:hypothetical protein
MGNDFIAGKFSKNRIFPDIVRLTCSTGGSQGLHRTLIEGDASELGSGIGILEWAKRNMAAGSKHVKKR